jgi:hypothetical protein
MLKRVLLVAALVAKMAGIAMVYQATSVAAEDCLPCPPPCYPTGGCC